MLGGYTMSHVLLLSAYVLTSDWFSFLFPSFSFHLVLLVSVSFRCFPLSSLGFRDLLFLFPVPV